MNVALSCFFTPAIYQKIISFNQPVTYIYIYITACSACRKENALEKPSQSTAPSPFNFLWGSTLTFAIK